MVRVIAELLPAHSTTPLSTPTTGSKLTRALEGQASPDAGLKQNRSAGVVIRGHAFIQTCGEDTTNSGRCTSRTDPRRSVRRTRASGLRNEPHRGSRAYVRRSCNATDPFTSAQSRADAPSLVTTPPICGTATQYSCSSTTTRRLRQSWNVAGKSGARAPRLMGG